MLQKISSLFFLLLFLQIAKAQQSIIMVKHQQFILNIQPYYFVGGPSGEAKLYVPCKAEESENDFIKF